MANENILAPDMKYLEKDEFYLFYEMMMQSLKTDDVKEGLNRSLYMLRSFLKSGNVALFKKNIKGNYVLRVSDSDMGDFIKPISCIVNKTKTLVEKKELFYIDLCLSERLDNMMFIYINIENSSINPDDECILAIINHDNNRIVESKFWERTRDTMKIILKRAASYERNVKAVTTDLLTGLDNRNSYEMRLQALNEKDKKLVVGIFDLFRLKNINDDYTHAKGDLYIKEAAKILNVYWPKERVYVNDDGSEEFYNTGHCVYRVGGDEFILFTTVENHNIARIKARLAKDESCLIDLGLGKKIPLGLNFGVVEHNPNDTIKQTIMRADEIMQEDKQDMYKKYNLERRH